MALPLALLHAQTWSSDPGGVLRHLTVARFAGSGADSIQAMTSDAAGNLYVAGTTASPDLPMKNAAQPAIGETPLTRSLDRGLTWQKVASPPVVPLTITPHPSDPQTLFVGGVDGVYKTTDGGQTWRHVYAWVTAFPTATGVFNIAIDPANPRQVCAYVFPWYENSPRFLTSTDGGDTWRPSAAPYPGSSVYSGARLLWVDPHGSGAVVVGTYLSRDRGTTWARMAYPPESNVSFTAPDPWHPGWLYAATWGSRLYLSTDWGVTWIEKATPPWTLSNLLFDPELPNTLYAPTSFGFYISDDGAASWHQVSRAFIERIGVVDWSFRPALLSRQCMGGALLAVVTGQKVAASLDFGSTWQTPQLARVLDLAAGPGCAVYAARSVGPDAFVAKLSPGGGEVLWSTFLGGADADASVAIALDPQGNVYVAGNTASADFPATAPRIGQQGQRNLFAAKFDPDGKRLYSVVLGGESSDTLTAMAVGPEGDVHLVGRTTSKSFPATPGAYQTEAGIESDFAVRLGLDGRVVYASYLPRMWSQDPVIGTYSPVAVAAEAGGSALIGGGYDGVLSRMAPDGASLTAVARVGGTIFVIEKDRQDNVYLAGQAGDPSGSASCFYGERQPYLPPGDIFVTKLRPAGLEQVYSARLFGHCRSWPGVLRIGATGEVTVGLWTWDTFPLRSPVLASVYGRRSAVVSRLSADGSALLFSSYLDMSQAAPAIAVGPDDSLYAGVTRAYSATLTHAGILRLPVAFPGAPSVENAFNAFGGDSVGVAPGALMTITGQNLSSDWIDLGLNFPAPLPTELGGVQVRFDGHPAQMLQATPERVICVVPDHVKDWTTVQVIGPAGALTPFLFWTWPSYYYAGRGLLTRSFPDPPPAKADGNIRNADGTLNDAQHPAALGSTVTLFATGLSGPGQVGLFWAPFPPEYVYLPRLSAVYGTADTMPGFISALYQIRFKIPDAEGPGVFYLPPRGVLTRVEIQMGNTVGVYVK